MTDPLTSDLVLTPKQRVLKKYPAATSYRWVCGTVCVLRPFLGGNMTLGSGRGYANAWADALKNLRSGRV